MVPSGIVFTQHVGMRTRARLKPVAEQTIVITGGSSGIGLATATLAVEKGARVVICSNNARKLKDAKRMLRRNGDRVECFQADVADFGAMRNLAGFTIRKFGGFDTWINNAGIHIFGKLIETDPEDMRRLFDVNYWGMVHGCRAALEHLARRGGALINIASVLSSRSVPLQGVYGASKHAVQGYTDALRMEVERAGLPISVTSMQPAAIATPIPEHSKNLMDTRAQLPTPLYAPEVAARAILFCAEHPRRSFIVGTAGKLAVLGEKFAPALTDKSMETLVWRMQRAGGDPREQDNLHTAMSDRARLQGGQERFILRRSLYDNVIMHPGVVVAATAVAGLAAFALGRQADR